VIVVCCQVEVSATVRSFVQRRRTEWCVSLSVIRCNTPPPSKHQQYQRRKKTSRGKERKYFLLFMVYLRTLLPIPVTARSKARVCGRSLAGIVGSNPAGDTDVCLFWVLCVTR
jgi:hypothetical protein